MLGRRLLGLGLVLGGILFAINPGSAGVLDASWTAPTTNTDGSQLTDLAAYRVYYGTSASPCPGGTFVQVASTVASPPPNLTVSLRLTNLATGTLYTVSVTAVDTGDNESACSATASAVAQVDIAVTPTATVSFGNVNIGSVLDQVFTVQSTRSGPITGTASVPAPFSIVSGSPFTLVGAGATQDVTVRFTPTSTALASSSVSFAADGDTLSRLVTGTGVSTTIRTLTVAKAGSGRGTVTSNPAGIACGTTCAAAFTIGTLVTLTAAPDASSTFSGWSGSCTGTGTCTVTMSAARAVTATFAIPFSFTDDPLVARTTVAQAVHIVELRTAIAALRAGNGLPVFGWTDSTLAPGTTIKAVHILELRAALAAVYQQLQIALPSYTDPTIVAGETVSQAAHVQELRNAVRAPP